MLSISNLGCPLASLALGILPTVGCLNLYSVLACCSTFSVLASILTSDWLNFFMFGSCPSVEQLEIFCFHVELILLTSHLDCVSCRCTGISADSARLLRGSSPVMEALRAAHLEMWSRIFVIRVGWVWNGDRKNGLRLKDAIDTRATPDWAL